jgi:hypothetical protein
MARSSASASAAAYHVPVEHLHVAQRLRQVEAGRGECPEQRLGAAQQVRPQRRAGVHQLRIPDVPAGHRPAVQGDPAQLRPPVAGGRVGQRDLGDHVVEHEVDQPVLAVHVAVERHRAVFAEPPATAAIVRPAAPASSATRHGGPHDRGPGEPAAVVGLRGEPDEPEIGLTTR